MHKSKLRARIPYQLLYGTSDTLLTPNPHFQAQTLHFQPDIFHRQPTSNLEPLTWNLHHELLPTIMHICPLT